MYHKSDVRVTFEDEFAVLDSNNNSETMPDGTVYLPHRCQEWVVGGKKEVRQLIEDLQWQLDMLERED